MVARRAPRCTFFLIFTTWPALVKKESPRNTDETVGTGSHVAGNSTRVRLQPRTKHYHAEPAFV